jgi:hypothetical protein
MDQHGIYTFTGTNVKVVQNQISNTGYCGIYMDQNPSGTHRNLDVSWNQIADTGNSADTDFGASGIYFDADTGLAESTRICNNQIYDVGKAGHASGHGKGIWVDCSAVASQVTGCQIKHNQINNVQEEGIFGWLTNATATVLVGLTIDHNSVIQFSQRTTTLDGIRVARDATGTTMTDICIRNNLIGNTSGNYGDGIDVTDAQDDETVTGIIHGNHIFGTASGRTIRTSGARQVTIGINSTPGDTNPIYA